MTKVILEILMDLHMFIPLAHEQVDGFYSYSVFINAHHKWVLNEYQYSSSKYGVLQMCLKNKMSVFSNTGSNDLD
jgi:hypothetical protein